MMSVHAFVQAADVSPGPFGGAAPATLLFGGITVGDVAYWADSLMVAALINYASRESVCDTHTHTRTRRDTLSTHI